VILSALEDATEVDVISAPEVLVLNNQTAILQVGDQVPIATQSAVSVVAGGAPVVNTIEYRDTGVTLKVTPRVNQGGMVMMDISQEVSDVAATTTSTLDSPTINQRKISSTVAVHDGQTIALGGLISDNRTKSKSGIPVLQNIPVLGSLFATTDHQDSRTELLVLITPHVVENAQKAQSVTEELRRKLPMTRQLFPRPN
jgi:general secretion pathway protein D